MTLVVTVNGPESIWLMADRRVSFERRPPKEDALKVMVLVTPDATAILGYAGLGITGVGTEPSAWMSKVFRGRNFPLEESLAGLAHVMSKQLPRHMVALPPSRGPLVHNVVVPALVGGEARFYTIDLVLGADRRSGYYQYSRHVDERSKLHLPRRLSICGTGAAYLKPVAVRAWMRELMRMVDAYDCGQLSQLTVSDHLAGLNHRVHLCDRNGSVGDHCVVVCRNKGGVGRSDGGRHYYYTGTTRELSSPALPMIVAGLDVVARGEVFVPRMMKRFEEACRLGGDMRPMTPAEMNELNAAFAKISVEPDENLP